MTKLDTDMCGDSKVMPIDVDVSAVMPCLNEALTLPICIEKAKQAFEHMGLCGEVVVADNGSTDGSVEIAKAHGARVVHQPERGYGAALTAGILAARGRIVVMADADDSYDWSAIAPFVSKLDQGYDLVIGNRFRGGIDPGAMPPLHRYLGNPVLSFLARTFYRIPVGDFHCGMRAFRRECFDQMGVHTHGMEFATEMVVAASHTGLRITEIPTRLYCDKRDRPPHLRSFRDGWRHLRFMLTYAPDWLYWVPGLLMLCSGLAGMLVLSGGPVVIKGLRMGIHFLAVFSMLTMLGANVMGFGLLAKLFNAPRCPIAAGSVTARLLGCFTLERGLVAGLALSIGGTAVVVRILIIWLQHGRGDLSETVHLAFVATGMVALGVNLMFGSFLLSMLQNSRVRGEGVVPKTLA